ncbi:MAG: RDD family protein, partial [Pseudomonadota bacterium]
MSAAARPIPAPAGKRQRRLATSRTARQRELVTAEGLALALTLASRGSRVGALLLDLVLLIAALIAFLIALGLIGFNLLGNLETASPAVELIVVLVILLIFFARYGYFLAFELGPRGATPGKRALGIRVAARDGGRLTAEAVIARNLLRDFEVFMPLGYLISLSFG